VSPDPGPPQTRMRCSLRRSRPWRAFHASSRQHSASARSGAVLPIHQPQVICRQNRDT
jgi:hypothetical protein